MPPYFETALVGSQDGTRFYDIYVQDANGKVIINNDDKNVLDVDQPIRYITVCYSEEFVIGIAVNYGIISSDGKKNSRAIPHGIVPASNLGTPADAAASGPASTELAFQGSKVIYISDGEEIAAVFGVTAEVVRHERVLITKLRFLIYNKQTGETRFEGPFGTVPAAEVKNVKPFKFTDIVAFGGFTDHSKGSLTGLSGLTFFRKVGDN